MATKKQISASTSDDDDSSFERFVEQRAPSLKRKQRDNEEEEESESEDSSDKDENEQKDEEEAKSPATKEEKEAKSPVENSESLQPQKKKSKPNSVPGLSPSTTTNGAVQRVWSLEDELVLLQALSQYHNTYNQLPSLKEYKSFLSSIIGSLSFSATENQLHNKIRTWKTNYGQRKKISSKAKSLNSHEKIVFKICAKLFEDVGKTKSVGKMANSTSDDEARARCSIYLRKLISGQKLPEWFFTVEDVVQKLGEPRARDLEAKAKQLSMDAIKLHAREKELIAELLDVVADEMAGDA